MKLITPTMKASVTVMLIIGIILLTIFIVMLNYALDISIQDRQRTKEDPAESIFKLTRSIVPKADYFHSLAMLERYPYLVAITKNYSQTWSFACFACLIFLKWVVVPAHCRKVTATHRALLYHDFVHNYTRTYPILFWKIHDNYTAAGKYDIAVARLDYEVPKFRMNTYAIFSKSESDSKVGASVWKTVTDMNKDVYLTSVVESFVFKIAPQYKCTVPYKIELDESLICVDMSDSEDCFINDFGPIFNENKIVGLLASKPRHCDVKFAIFTNVSYYTDWILESIETAYMER